MRCSFFLVTFVANKTYMQIKKIKTPLRTSTPPQDTVMSMPKKSRSGTELSQTLKSILQTEKIPVHSIADIEKNIAARAAAQMHAYLQTARLRLQCTVAQTHNMTEQDDRIREILALLHNTPSLAAVRGTQQ